MTAKEVKALRAKLGLTQDEFWRALGITQSGGCRYERGDRAIPRYIQVLLHEWARTRKTARAWVKA